MIFHKESIFSLAIHAEVPGIVGFICSLIHAELPKILGSIASNLCLKSSQSGSVALGLVLKILGSVTLKKASQLESNKTLIKKKTTKPTIAIKRSHFCINKTIRATLLSTRMSRALGRIFAYCSNSEALMFHSAGMMTSFAKGFQSRCLKAYKNTSTIKATKG
jgi:hypothetical protein